MDKRTVPAEHFLRTLNLNVDNDKLSDEDFRTFIRNSLPIVIFDRYDKLLGRVAEKEGKNG